MADKTRILIADDHQLTLEGIRFHLKELGGFDVVTINNCDTALKLIKSN